CLLPARSFLAGCLASGDRASWCPNLFGGFSLLGEGLGTVHPWNRWLYGTFPLNVAFNLEVIWPFPVMLVGFAALMTKWGLGRDAAVVGGLVYALGGPHLMHYQQTTVMAGLAHLPWLLLAADTALRSQDPRRVLVARTAVSALTASQALIAHVQFVWISALAECGYVGYLLWQEPVARRRLVGLAISKGIGCLGGSLQLLPV